ncbi:response regulator [uncultured Paenibacillus sp.]|uniref:response regulator transcription factor n=1 Tax=uncultured Paenibacillus sp. TaxID=227322 RepID=UPI0028D85AB5|nr:response regulator [uncultured Paenibacillus sp.]
MYHVLVADDEPRHRRGIADMIRMLRPDYLVFTAKDGDDALRIIEKNRIDILLTDIRMPNMDGLQLIESLGTRMESIKVVILSVYGHFDYARQAIKLGAFDYLLKPLELHDMADMLAKLDNSLQKDRERRQDGENLRERLNSAIPVYEQHLLSRWMRSAVGDAELREIGHLFPDARAGFVVLAKFDTQQIAQTYLPSEFEEVKASFKGWIQQAHQALGPSISFYLEGTDQILVSVIARDKPLEWLMKRDVERLFEFIDQLRIEFELSVSIGVGGRVTDLYKDVCLSFEQAWKALDYTFYSGKGKLVFHDEIAYDPNKPALRMVPSDAEIAAALTQSNREMAVIALDSLITRLLHGGYPSPLHLKESILYVLINQVKASEAVLRNEEASNLIAEMEFKIPVCATLDEVKDQAIHYLHRIIDAVESRKNNKNQRIIEMCIAYLEEHYMEDLSLEATARKFFFSPAYFSSFFKAHTSRTFTEYLLGLRMAKAKALLHEGERKVSDIALKVGFRDAGYFTRMFKRETGHSPEEFRKNVVL